ncbi:MAG: 2'-5' RNA ligase family protein, partial [Pirellula sp.]|nr:2'-5' RNA ligase family protein [Pirellula sp.]
MLKRRQASLFLVDQFQIEAVRSRYNPIQARLIPAHVTLCREDEVCDWETLRSKLESLRPFEITLTFGIPVREGNFVYLPVVDGLDLYQDFRRRVLSKDARIQMPHLTLIHPRNGVCTD